VIPGKRTSQTVETKLIR